jgi:DNA-directed RNA polymerase specialized sigma subunit
MKQCVREVYASARPVSVTMESAALEDLVSIGYILATELTML